MCDYQNTPKEALAPSAVAGAKWWGSFLRKGTRTAATEEVGNLGACAPVVNQVIEKLRAHRREKQTPEKLDLFEEYLAEVLSQKLVWATQRGHNCVVTRVDYQPDAILSDVAKDAGLEDLEFIFPLKARCSVFVDKVEVAVGYDPSQVIWEAPIEAREAKT